MAVKQVLLCDRCGKEVKPNPVLGDLQGGPVDLRFPGFGTKLLLDEECMDELYELFGQYGERAPNVAAARGAEQLKYLPFIPAE